MQVPLVACIEYVKLGRKITRRKIVLLCAMTAGVAVACASDVKFTFVGAFIAAAGVACTSVEIVLYSHLQQAHGWETLQLLYNTMPYCSAGGARPSGTEGGVCDARRRARGWERAATEVESCRR